VKNGICTVMVSCATRPRRLENETIISVALPPLQWGVKRILDFTKYPTPGDVGMGVAGTGPSTAVDEMVKPGIFAGRPVEGKTIPRVVGRSRITPKLGSIPMRIEIVTAFVSRDQLAEKVCGATFVASGITEEAEGP